MAYCKVAAAEIFRECFEGVAPGSSGTWFVQGHEGIFDALQSLTAEQASKHLTPQTATMAAHLYHLNYYLSLFNASTREESPESDWEGSWKHQEFTEDAWRELAADVQREFDAALTWYKGDSPFKDEVQTTYAIANIAHAAYHLGAVRALLGVALR